MHLGSVRRNRMRVGYRAWRVFFFVTIVTFFVSIMFVLRKDRGTLHRGKGDLHKSSGMRGRCWIYVCDRWKDRIGLGRIGWDLEEGWKEELKLFFLLILLCCPLVSWSSSIVGVVVVVERKPFFPRTLRDLSSIVLALAFLFRFINAHSPYRDSPFVLIKSVILESVLLCRSRAFNNRTLISTAVSNWVTVASG